MTICMLHVDKFVSIASKYLQLETMDVFFICMIGTMHGTMLGWMLTSKPYVCVKATFFDVQAPNVVDNKVTNNNNKELVIDPMK